jgi:hypothetical protein
MPWRKAMLVWLLIIAIESVQGVLRNVFLAPVIGDFAARQIGVLFGAAVIVLVAWLMAPWLNLQGRAQFAVAGLLWVGLTVAFELSLGLALGLPWQRMAADYDITSGGLLGLGLIVLAFAPYAAARLRAIGRICKRND